LTTETWTPIYIGIIGGRNVRIEIDGSSALRAITTLPGSDEEVIINGGTRDELEDRLVVYAEFSERQAIHILRKAMER